MKKLLGISLVAILAATPLMARAADGEPVGTGSTPVTESGAAVTATGDAPFALIGSNAATDGNAATAGYVKGAYNAAIKAVNTVHDEAAAAQAAAEAAAAAAVYTGADGINITNNEVSVDLTTNGGLQVNETTKKLEVVTDDSTIVKDSTTGALGVAANTFDAYGAADEAEEHAIDYADTHKVDKDNIATSLTAQSTDAQVASAKAVYDELADKLEETDFSTGTTAGTIKVGNTDVAVNVQGFATETGVVNTIKNTNISVGEFALASGAVSGSITVPMMDDWSSPNTVSSTGLVVNGNAIQLAVGTAIDEGTVAIDDNSVSYPQQ